MIFCYWMKLTVKYVREKGYLSGKRQGIVREIHLADLADTLFIVNTGIFSEKGFLNKPHSLYFPLMFVQERFLSEE